MSGKTASRQHRQALAQQRTRQAHRRKARTRLLAVGLTVVVFVVVGVLYGVYRSATDDTTATGGTRSYQVGEPGVGATAPGFDLASSTGGRLDLASLRGQTVLLYFQEGLGCQPCWDQIRDLEHAKTRVKAAGIDRIVSITTDPVDLLTRKVADDRLTTPVLPDPDLAVSKKYNANRYGMMGTSRDGHTFILVDPDGTIRWRADYGGAPKYTMYVKVNALLADLKAGRR